MKKIWFIVNVEAAIYKNDKWLIIKRSEKEEHAPGKLSLVGGKVEDVDFSKNVLEDTIKREIIEEVGIEVDERMEYVLSQSFKSDNNQNVVDVVFLCQYKSGEATSQNDDEVSDVLWLTTKEILENENSPEYLKESIIKANNLKKCLSKR